MNALKTIWGLASGFLGGLSIDTWLIVGAVAGFGLWTWQVYDAGYDKADALWKAKALEARIEQLEREKFTQLLADAEKDKADTEMSAENAELKKKVDDYEERLKTRPDADRCTLTDDDINGLP